MKKRMICICLILMVIIATPLHQAKADCYSISNDKVYISRCELNFNRCTKNEIPTLYMRVNTPDWGEIKVKIRSSIPWLVIKQVKNECDVKEYDFSVDTSQLSFDLYKGEILIETTRGNYTIPVRLDLVEKTVKIKYIPKSLVTWVDGKEIPLKEPAFLDNEYLWIPLRLTVESFGGTIDYETDSSKNITAFTLHYKDLQERLIVCDRVKIRRNQAFVGFGTILNFLKCKCWYVITEGEVEFEY
jgi:hypothetical protein